jgi:RNA polymerase sigma factor (sigma-70 family)
MAAPELNVRANAALDDLYRRHVGDVYRYTYAVLGNHADAEDVTQTTFVNALRALERGDQPRDPSNWLLAISHNIVRQRWRQAAVRPTEVELVTDVPDESTEPDVELDELVRALQRIPPAQREALVMRELEGRSYNEISEVLGLTISALETLLFRARRSLAEELQNIVTCQSAELAMSKQLDGRLSRKERRRLDEHLAECDACAKLAETQRRQRRAFKGLAVLPIPVGLALFKGVPTASAATLPTIGIGAPASGTGVGATGVGAGGTGAGAAGAGGATAAAGSAVTGGSILGGAVAKVAAVVIAGTVATGVGYEGVKAITSDAKPTPARSSDERAATPS